MRTSQPSPYGSSLIVSGAFDHGLVDGDDLAGERCDQVGDRLHGLDLAVRLVLRDLRALLGRLEVDEVAERVGGEPRDPERRLVALDARPVVLGVVAQVGGVALLGGHQLSSLR